MTPEERTETAMSVVPRPYSVDDIKEWIHGYECFPSRLPKGSTRTALRTAVEALEPLAKADPYDGIHKTIMVANLLGAREALASIRKELGIEQETKQE